MAKIRSGAAAWLPWKNGTKFTSLSQRQSSTHGDKTVHRMRKAVLAAAGLAGLALLINLIFLIVGTARFESKDGVGVIYTGGCNRVKHWDTALHLLINVLGIALLGASSFTMQCLSSPTRTELDRAHAKRVSLDIGIASVKNLSYLHWKRGVLWWALAMSSLPLHLL